MSKSFVNSLVMAGAMLFAMPVEAAYTFNTVGSDIQDNGSYGNSKTFQSVEAGLKINVKVTAWQASASNYTISNAYLGAYSHGLGVTGAGDYNGDYNYHQIDNVNGFDFVLLQFDKAVSITTIGRETFDLPYVSDDNDAQIKAVNFGGAQWNSNLTLSGQLGTTGWINVDGTGADGNTTFTNNTTSTQWLIAASLASGTKNDGFKLDLLKVQYTPPTNAVPEPATWAMMLTGFGLIGTAARRRRTVQAAA